MQKQRYTIDPISPFSEADLTSLFEAFAETPWALLLDSAGDITGDNRFDIMLVDPQTTLVTEGLETRIWTASDGHTTISSDDPLILAERIHADFAQQYELPSTELARRLPFIAGVAGAFGYDLGRRFEYLPSRFSNEYQCPDMAVGLYTRSLILDKHCNTLYDCRPETALPFSQWCRAFSPKNVQAPFQLTEPWQANLNKQEYTRGIDAIHAYLNAGDCYQVNFAQRFSAGYTGSEWQAYLNLRHANKAPFSAYARLPQATLLSISPERFLAVSDGKVQTKPIKGTRPRSDDPEEDSRQANALLTSIKDRAENLMIVDLLRNDISKHCQPHSVRVPAPFALESYAAVHHMVTTVEGELAQDASPFQLLRDAFPGGSITGAPKIRAMQIIDELEANGRNIYCGSIGYVGLKNDMDTSICIRTLLCENHRVYCWAGGGIVLDSTAEDEFQESLDKVNKIIPILHD
ncbi:aminodeoxychorismate synthase component I [Alteromonas oceanisediminis]|uniref:aminodeoxychorismate synthase component I n=1 Tax=Alteromonas oceanisediminis TaxID=2836180 RepID=UPI001BD982E9|nr:aminodeoxychorismate synthase component I [Alteromonas oceanisediminis]MBT0587160.1 aminodeoxychorismate synthase component I [Alteromonas oceanisediminis]